MYEYLSEENIKFLNYSFKCPRFNFYKNANGYNWMRTIWSGGWNSYTGTVTAGERATLAGLAELITGDANDWKEISKKPTVRVGQPILIAPLLKKLELMLRVKVAAATKRFNADFGNLTVSAGEDSSRNINEYFDGNRSPASDCNGAIGIVMSKGLIDTASDYEYNQLAIDDIFGILASKKGTLATMLIGDSGWIQNYDDYLEQVQDNSEDMAAFQAENVIKVARGKFWGHIGEPYGRSVKTPTEWETLLREAYNKIADKKRYDKVPGHDGEVKFLNVADIAMKLFDIRRRNKK